VSRRLGCFIYPSSQAAAVPTGACSTPSFLTSELIHRFFSPGGVVTGDFNGDHHLDLVELDGSDVAVLLGNGSGAFAPPIVYHLGPNSGNLAVADLNNDGKLDVVVRGNASSGNGVIVSNVGVSVVLGDGAGNFGTLTGFRVGGNSVVVDDLDGDGKLDIATPYAIILYNTCGASVTPTPTPTPSPTATPTPSPTPSPTPTPSPAPVLLPRRGQITPLPLTP
jgi:hypothetical protein